MGTPETQQLTSTKLNRIAWLSAQDPDKKFECLMHLFNNESLTGCFHRLDKGKAVGMDGILNREGVVVKGIILSPLP